uniref:Beta/gamma crystallin 'Greek key' domain-containing protein n=1 Tax=Cyprinus carpio TaxID=7962 RepID=A0A8C1T5P6_CYPCA
CCQRSILNMLVGFTTQKNQMRRRGMLRKVHSCKVIRGIWRLYKDPDYSGDHYLLKEGEYRNLNAGCDSISTTSAPIQLYEKVNFEGRNFETTGDCPSLDHCGITEVRSCKVLSGVWDLYEGPDYTEPRHSLQNLEYLNPEAWGASDNTAPALSVKRRTE